MARSSWQGQELRRTFKELNKEMGKVDRLEEFNPTEIRVKVEALEDVLKSIKYFYGNEFKRIVTTDRSGTR